jgi:FtsP/CotA-like multicopper oxidase with cupredoxin domain
LQRLVTLLVLVAACTASSSAAAARIGPSTLGAPWLAAIPEVRSAHGVASLALRAALDPGGRPAFFWQGREVAPTIRVHPGDQIRVHYRNDLPEYCGLGMVSATNLHFHGLSTPPVAPGDEVITTNVAPGRSYDYTIRIAPTQPAGLYWYHPHAHRLANWEISNGMAGAIVVEGIADALPQLAGLRERVIVLRDVPHDPSVAAAESGEHGPRPALVARAAAGKPPPLEADDFQGTTPCGVESEAQTTINGAPAAAIGIRPRERQLWRVLNASGTRHFDLAVAGLRFALVGLDGVPLADAPGATSLRWVEHVLVPPGGRAEFLVTGPARLPQLLLSRCYDAGPTGDVNPGTLLGELVDDAATTAAGRVAPPGGRTPDALVRRLPEPAARRIVRFEEDAKGFYIDRRAYDPAAPPAIVARAGTVESWTLVNDTDEVHVFHIHQVHFIAGGTHEWRDVVDIAPRRRITVLVDFRDPAVRGTFLFHCHLTDHEDGGMMAKIRVI